jgi:hypothetical protein
MEEKQTQKKDCYASSKSCTHKLSDIISIVVRVNQFGVKFHVNSIIIYFLVVHFKFFDHFQVVELRSNKLVYHLQSF